MLLLIVDICRECYYMNRNFLNLKYEFFNLKRKCFYF